MEFYVFFGILIAVVIILLWRSRRSTTSWRESPNAGLPDDQRDKLAYPEDASSDPLWSGVPRQRPVSRESGHGKDGGG